MDQRWLYRTADGIAGPVSAAALRELIDQGTVSAETDVCPQGGDVWGPLAQQAPEFFGFPAAAQGGWADRKPHPWRRYFARVLDNVILGAFVWIVIGTVAFAVDAERAGRVFAVFSAPGGQILDAMATLLVMIPVHALMIGLTGSSPGKWIFGVRVLRHGKAIGVPAAFARELSVWGRGLALGVPLVSLMTLLSSYTHLTENGSTPWDAGQRNVVVHRRAGAVQTLLTVFGVVAIVVGAVLVRVVAAA